MRLERFVVYAVTDARRFVSLIPKVRSPSTHRRERKASPLLLICGAYLYYTCRTLRCWAAACCWYVVVFFVLKLLSHDGPTSVTYIRT